MANISSNRLMRPLTLIRSNATRLTTQGFSTGSGQIKPKQAKLRFGSGQMQNVFGGTLSLDKTTSGDPGFYNYSGSVRNCNTGHMQINLTHLFANAVDDPNTLISEYVGVHKSPDGKFPKNLFSRMIDRDELELNEENNVFRMPKGGFSFEEVREWFAMPNQGLDEQANPLPDNRLAGKETITETFGGEDLADQPTPHQPLKPMERILFQSKQKKRDSSESGSEPWQSIKEHSYAIRTAVENTADGKQFVIVQKQNLTTGEGIQTKTRVELNTETPGSMCGIYGVKGVESETTTFKSDPMIDINDYLDQEPVGHKNTTPKLSNTVSDEVDNNDVGATLDYSTDEDEMTVLENSQRSKTKNKNSGTIDID